MDEEQHPRDLSADKRPPTKTELGRLLQGNRFSNERYGQRLSKMRRAALESFEPADVVRALKDLQRYGMAALKKGNHKPICEWLDRVGITASSFDMEDRINVLQDMLAQVASKRMLSPQEPPEPVIDMPPLDVEAEITDILDGEED